MSYWNFTRSPASVHLLVEFGKERGLTDSQMLARSGLTRGQLSDPNVQITATQELCVAGNLVRRLRRLPGLGMELGMRYHFSVYGVWGYGLISSRSGADALDLAVRFLPLTYAFTTITLQRHAGSVWLRFVAPDVQTHLQQFLVERDMAAAVVLLSEVNSEKFSLDRICFRTATPSAGNHRFPSHVLGAVPEFGFNANCLIFRESHLLQTLPQANPVTAAMCEQMCARLLEQRRLRVGTRAMVSQYLNAFLDNAPADLPSIAKMLNTSPRTLKRRLQSEGTSFTQLLSTSRAERAQELMQDPQLTVTEIADQMGFADLSSFSQAFRRWHGVTPSAFRKSVHNAFQRPERDR